MFCSHSLGLPCKHHCILCRSSNRNRLKRQNLQDETSKLSRYLKKREANMINPKERLSKNAFSYLQILTLINKKSGTFFNKVAIPFADAQHPGIYHEKMQKYLRNIFYGTNEINTNFLLQSLPT